MYIKLNFTADQPLNYIFRVINECINTTGITSIATLQSTATANTWHATLLQNLDTVNSEIIRSGSGATALTTAKTVSHYTKNGTDVSYTDQHAWTVEFSRYDDNTKKYYVQHYNASGLNNYYSVVRLADGLNSGTLTSVSAMAPSVAPLASSSVGTAPTFNSSVYNPGTYYVGNGTTGFSTVRSFTMYISDFGMIWCATHASSFNIGFGNTYSDSTKFTGPFIYSQYTRFDYHNTNANGITPLMFTASTRGTGTGFGAVVNDWTGIENTQYTTSPSGVCCFKVFNLINAYPTTGASYPVIAQPQVNWGVGSRYNDVVGLTSTANGGNVLANPTYGAAIFTTVSTRYPSADLKTQTYGMLPVSWRNTYYYNAGGDASAKAGWYCFNGDYFPGDEFSYSGKTYKILPTWTGYSNRVGIAIPKE